jgi:CRP/FNR family cyclic AMP-dependent transcriptional regulator
MIKDKKPTQTRKSRQGEKTLAAAVLDPQTVLLATNGAGSDLKLRPEEVVFRQGDPADAVFYIKTGRVQLTVVSDHGREGIIALFGPGDFFGEGCLAAQPVRLASAAATTASSIVKIEKNAMVGLLHEKQDFSEKFMAFLMTRNIQVEADLVDQLFNSSEKRLARLLLLLANFNSEGELRLIIPKISQEALAARVGTTRPRISYFMNKFRKLGLIEYDGNGVKVHTALLSVIVQGLSSKVFVLVVGFLWITEAMTGTCLAGLEEVAW